MRGGNVNIGFVLQLFLGNLLDEDDSFNAPAGLKKYFNGAITLILELEVLINLKQCFNY